MVIMFRGTKVSKNYAPQALSLYAGINAIKYGRKTLVIQLMREHPVENYLTGKQNKAGTITGTEYRFENNNIDTLFRHAGIREVEKEQFDNCGMQMLTEKDKLTVIRVSSRQGQDFEKDFVSQSEDMNAILEAAKKFYDDIYIFGNGKNREMMEKINPMVDISIVCVPQGQKEEIPEMITYEKPKEIPAIELEENYDEEEPEENKKKEKAKPLNEAILMITNFDKGSSFSPDYISKAYNIPKNRIALFPYNVNFKDAYNTDNVLQFAMRNTKVYRSDDNFELMRCVFDVMKKVMNNDFPPEEEMAFPYIKNKIQLLERQDLRVLDESNIVYTKKYTGFFGKKQEKGYDVLMDSDLKPTEKYIKIPAESQKAIEDKKPKKGGFFAFLFGKKKKDPDPDVEIEELEKEKDKDITGPDNVMDEIPHEDEGMEELSEALERALENDTFSENVEGYEDDDEPEEIEDEDNTYPYSEDEIEDPFEEEAEKEAEPEEEPDELDDNEEIYMGEVDNFADDTVLGYEDNEDAYTVKVKAKAAPKPGKKPVKRALKPDTVPHHASPTEDAKEASDKVLRRALKKEPAGAPKRNPEGTTVKEPVRRPVKRPEGAQGERKAVRPEGTRQISGQERLKRRISPTEVKAPAPEGIRRVKKTGDRREV